MKLIAIIGLVALGAIVVWVGAGYSLLARAPGAANDSQDCTERANLPSGMKGRAPAALGDFDLKATLGDPRSSGLSSWPAPFDAAPKLFDLDGDGDDEAIALSNDTHVYVFDTQSGDVLARLPTRYPSGWYIEGVLNGVEAARLTPASPPSIIVTDHAACVTVWTLVPGESRAGQLAFEKSWERRMSDCFWNPGMDAKASLADADEDGDLELFVQTEEVGFFALEGNGDLLWKQCWAGGNAAPVLDDLDTDGDLEAIFASDAGFISVVDAASGEPQWTYDLASHGINPASISVAPTVAELDGKAPKELLVTARHAPSDKQEDWPSFHMAIAAIHQDPETWQAELLWLRQPGWAHPLSYTHLVVDDVDGDGRQDIFGMDWNTIGHAPGDWENLGAAHLFRLDEDGRDVWVRNIDAWWSNKDIALSDSNGDGRLDLLANAADPVTGFDGLVRVDAESGKVDGYIPMAWKLKRGPLLADLRHDGQMQLVVPVEPVLPDEYRGAILVYELDVPYSARWAGAP